MTSIATEPGITPLIGAIDSDAIYETLKKVKEQAASIRSISPSYKPGVPSLAEPDSTLTQQSSESVKELTTFLQNFSEKLKQAMNQHSSQPTMSGEVYAILLAMLMEEVKTQRTQISVEAIKSTQEIHRREGEENLSKIRESMEKAKEAEKGGVIGKVFAWIAVVAVLVVSIVSAPFTGGSSLMLAAAVVGIVGGLIGVLEMIPLNEEGQGIFSSAITELAVLLGASREQALKIGQWVSFAVQMLCALVCVGPALCHLGKGLYKLGSSMFKSADDVAQAGAKAAQEAAISANAASAMASKTELICNKLALVSQYIGTAATAGSAATEASVAVLVKHAKDAEADATQAQANTERAEMDLDWIRQTIAQMLKQFNEILTSLAGTIEDTTKTSEAILARAARPA